MSNSESTLKLGLGNSQNGVSATRDFSLADRLLNLLKANNHVHRVLRFLWNKLIGAGARSNEPLVRILHLPRRFSRRHGHFTASICGAISLPLARAQKHLDYRINDGHWCNIKPVAGLFVIELSVAELCSGVNHVTIRSSVNGRQPEITALQFEYDPTPITLPITLEWSKQNLEVGDGYWETFCDKGEWRVRPKPGYEGYDRILVAAGAFSGGRRVETDLIFRDNKWPDYGFGIMPLYGGRPDENNVNPRRGWNFACTWYWQRYHGVGNEFSYRYGGNSPTWVNSYRNLTLEPGTRYFVKAECWPELDDSQRHRRFRNRMKWWKQGTQEPDEWLDLTDEGGSPLPTGEYGIALIAYRCQADFGQVVITPLPRNIGVS